MHPAHQDGKFIVPRKDDAPDVGILALPYTEPLGDEITELASDHCSLFVERTTNLAALVTFGRAVVDLIERRGSADVVDFAHPVAAPAAPKVELNAEDKRRLVSAELGRILDWICKGRRVLDMGVRVAVVASHIRARAIDHRTDQQLAHEVGNDSRESVSKVRREFRRDLGANYPGEHGKSSDTKKRCKSSRIKRLKS